MFPCTDKDTPSTGPALGLPKASRKTKARRSILRKSSTKYEAAPEPTPQGGEGRKKSGGSRGLTIDTGGGLSTAATVTPPTLEGLAMLEAAGEALRRSSAERGGNKSGGKGSDSGSASESEQVKTRNRYVRIGPLWGNVCVRSVNMCLLSAF